MIDIFDCDEEMIIGRSVREGRKISVIYHDSVQVRRGKVLWSFTLICYVQIPHSSSNEKKPTIFIFTNNLICHPFCLSYDMRIGTYFVSLIMLTIILLVEVTTIVD